MRQLCRILNLARVNIDEEMSGRFVWPKLPNWAQTTRWPCVTKLPFSARNERLFRDSSLFIPLGWRAAPGVNKRTSGHGAPR